MSYISLTDSYKLRYLVIVLNFIILHDRLSWYSKNVNKNTIFYESLPIKKTCYFLLNKTRINTTPKSDKDEL